MRLETRCDGWTQSRYLGYKELGLVGRPGFLLHRQFSRSRSGAPSRRHPARSPPANVRVFQYHESAFTSGLPSGYAPSIMNML